MKKLLIGLLSTLVVVSSVEAGHGHHGWSNFGSTFGAVTAANILTAPRRETVVIDSSDNSRIRDLKRKLEETRDDLADRDAELKAAKKEIKRLEKQLETCN